MGVALWHSDLQGRGVTEMLLGPLKRCTEPEISAKRRWQRNLGNIFSELLYQPIEHSREGSIWRVNSQITGVVHPFLHVLAWLLKKAYLETKTYVLLHNWVERRQELGKRGAFCGAPFRSFLQGQNTHSPAARNVSLWRLTIALCMAITFGWRKLPYSGLPFFPRDGPCPMSRYLKTPNCCLSLRQLWRAIVALELLKELSEVFIERALQGPAQWCSDYVRVLCFGGSGFAGLDPGSRPTLCSSSHAVVVSHVQNRGRLAIYASLRPIFLTRKTKQKTCLESQLFPVPSCHSSLFTSLQVYLTSTPLPTCM